ncbi:MAG: hypothetical protein U0P47_07355 [Acidimicrobiales bacterium]
MLRTGRRRQLQRRRTGVDRDHRRRGHSLEDLDAEVAQATDSDDQRGGTRHEQVR